MVVIKVACLMEGECHVMEVASFKGGRIVMLQKWSV